MQPLISIVVPVYKVEKYIRRCIDSLLAQTWKNIEIILVDDGSPDSCGQICEEYAAVYDKIRVLHKEIGGLSDARNAGIAVAQGEYIGFVDSDDYIMPDMFEKLAKAAMEQHVKLSMCSFFCIDSDGNDTEFSGVNPISDGIFAAEELLPKIVQTNGWFFIVAWNKLYHRSLLDHQFYPYGKYHEDEFVISQLLYRAQKIVCISDKEYCYIYKRADSITGSTDGIKHLDALEALYERCMFYHKHGLDKLIFDNRTIFLRELEKNYCNLNFKDKTVKNRMAELSDLYGKIPGRGKNETLRWYLLRINPKFEMWMMQKINALRRVNG